MAYICTVRKSLESVYIFDIENLPAKIMPRISSSVFRCRVTASVAAILSGNPLLEEPSAICALELTR